ncbi:hypothetical protein N7541_003590 [Penicillium brevicompactum]|uniref:Uncharacterized protein n=1 Tax=Penicillium brevicompactum TaxID=5074 RepID=A0A9W9RM31_PENBR|nr:hypothetical protein N7541_003590 [Penicillium brevicompactum]
MAGLLNSRWAPGAPGAPSERFQRSHPRPQPSGSVRLAPPGSLLPPAEELSRFMKIVARLRWKLPFLAEGYRLATATGDQMPDEVAHAEIMFKIDFHEYYALLERAIVHLLAVFNIAVTSSRAPFNANTNANGHGHGHGNGQSVGVHRYHANVLEALREQTTPLSPVLGSGPVYLQLQKAKELRNRWKTADLTKEERERHGERSDIVRLADFDFEGILSGIFGGLEESYVRAKDHVDKCVRPDDLPGQTNTEADWGFMVDAMDWEAV